VSSAFHCTFLQLAALTRTPKINPESRSQTNANAQRGKAATELREAFGVRGACSRFRTAPRLATAPASWTLQTLRVAVHPQKSSQLANNFDYCSAKVQKQKLRNHLPEFLISKFI
jgi:hypothetical protein